MVTPVTADETHSPLLCQTLLMNLLRLSPGLPTFYTHLLSSQPLPAQPPHPVSLAYALLSPLQRAAAATSINAPSSSPAPTQSSSCTHPPNPTPPRRTTTTTHTACNHPCLVPCPHAFLPPLASPCCETPHTHPRQAPSSARNTQHNTTIEYVSTRFNATTNTKARLAPLSPPKHCTAQPPLKRSKPLNHTNRPLQLTASLLPTCQHRSPHWLNNTQHQPNKTPQRAPNTVRTSN